MIRHQLCVDIDDGLVSEFGDRALVLPALFLLSFLETRHRFRVARLFGSLAIELLDLASSCGAVTEILTDFGSLRLYTNTRVDRCDPRGYGAFTGELHALAGSLYAPAEAGSHCFEQCAFHSYHVYLLGTEYSPYQILMTR